MWIPYRGSDVMWRWIAAWPGGAVIGVLNGTAREVLYARRTGDRSAHQISTVTIIALLAAYFVALDRRWPLRTRGEALGAGGGWLLLTTAFEFGFGHWVAKEDWPQLLADYDLRRGRLWSLVLGWTALGPLVVHAGPRRVRGARVPGARRARTTHRRAHHLSRG